MSVDIWYLTHNRLEFTRQTLDALWKNTDWSLVRHLYLFDDGSSDGTMELVSGFFERESHLNLTVDMTCCYMSDYGSPVAIMNEAIERTGPGNILAKIDNDTMVPPGWLNECLAVMEREPVDLLGIEAMHPAQVKCEQRRVAPAQTIGGIGLFRTEVFKGPMTPNGRLGFWQWQQKHPEVRKAWLSPAIPVCLLDRMTQEPWASLSQEYIAKGWQRPWQMYSEKDAALWEWFA